MEKNFQDTFASPRNRKALNLSTRNAVRPIDRQARTYRVQSETDPARAYAVDLTEMTCTCPDHEYRGIVCKHMKAAQLFEQKHADPAVVVVITKYRTYDQLFAALGLA